MQINRAKFYEGYREAFGPLNQGQVDGLELLLTMLESDTHVADLRWAAYMLATTKHETADTFKPVSEDGKGRGLKYGIMDPDTHQTYYGRGYVQITWRDNYATMTKVTGKDLVHHADLAMDPATAYQIMSYGMRTGAFTGKGLPDYINKDACDYFNARRIINGTDCAARVAKFARGFEDAIRAAA